MKDRLHMGDSHLQDTDIPKDILCLSHNAGFFSCCTIALCDIMSYFNMHHKLPDVVDRSFQFSFYKAVASDNLIPLFFNEDKEFNLSSLGFLKTVSGGETHYSNGRVDITHENVEAQYSDYKKLLLHQILPFVSAYFAPSDEILTRVTALKEKYNIDYANTCAVLYRGNDKVKEYPRATYDEFSIMAQEYHHSHRFFVLPDENEFWDYFNSDYDNSFKLDETPNINKDLDTANFYQIEQSKRADYAAWFLAAIIVASKCDKLITHSGNVSMWCVLYRGKTDGVHQWQNGKWI